MTIDQLTWIDTGRLWPDGTPVYALPPATEEAKGCFKAAADAMEDES